MTDLATLEAQAETFTLEWARCEIVSHFKRSMEAIAYCGNILRRVHTTLDSDSSFRVFCDLLPFTYRTAYHYMRLYDHSQQFGLDTLITAGISMSAWYKIPVSSDAATIALDKAKSGKRITANEARAIVQESGIEEPEKANAWEEIAQQNPRHFAESVARGAVTDPVTGDDIPLSQADPTLARYAALEDETERIKRQRQHIADNTGTQSISCDLKTLSYAAGRYRVVIEFDAPDDCEPLKFLAIVGKRQQQAKAEAA